MRILAFALSFMILISACGTNTTTTQISGFPKQAVRGEDKSVSSTIPKLPTTLRIGELNKSDNLDPLFISNSSSRRLVNLIYEGLVKFNENDKIAPSLAKSWKYSSDSLTVTFTLNNRFFHDDAAFNNGLGRKVSSFDVKRCFERMAKLTVPSDAAKLFLANIRGFDAYYREQHEVFDVEKRRLTEVVGVQTPNDSTVRFLLSTIDRDFLKKLATPFAVIYPDEVVKKYAKGLARNPIGTGIWKLESFTADTLVYLSKNSQHPHSENVYLDRVEVLLLDNESTMYKRLMSGNVQMIPKLGPLMLKNLVDDSGNVNPDYQATITVQRLKSFEKVGLYLNEDNYDKINASEASVLLTKINASDLSISVGPNNFSYTPMVPIGSNQAIFQQFPPVTASNDKVIFAFDSDQESKFYGRIIGNILMRDIGLRLIQSQIISNDIHLFLKNNIGLYPGYKRVETGRTKLLATISTSRASAQTKSVSGIIFNSLDWWMDLSDINISDTSLVGEASRL